MKRSVLKSPTAIATTSKESKSSKQSKSKSARGADPPLKRKTKKTKDPPPPPKPRKESDKFVMDFGSPPLQKSVPKKQAPLDATKSKHQPSAEYPGQSSSLKKPTEWYLVPNTPDYTLLEDGEPKDGEPTCKDCGPKDGEPNGA